MKAFNLKIISLLLVTATLVATFPQKARAADWSFLALGNPFGAVMVLAPMFTGAIGDVRSNIGIYRHQLLNGVQTLDQPGLSVSEKKARLYSIAAWGHDCIGGHMSDYPTIAHWALEEVRDSVSLTDHLESTRNQMALREKLSSAVGILDGLDRALSFL